MIEHAEMWMPPIDALDAVEKVTHSRTDAADLLLDALRGGSIHTRGVPSDPLVRRRDQEAFELPEEALVAHFIPSSFWAEASPDEQAAWSWRAGTLGSSPADSFKTNVVEYFEVEFARVDVRGLCEEIGPLYESQRSTDPKMQAERANRGGRPRAGGWDNWIAYLAFAVADGRVFGNMTGEDVRKVVADDMASDNIDQMSRSTVLKATTRVLEVLTDVDSDEAAPSFREDRAPLFRDDVAPSETGFYRP